LSVQAVDLAGKRLEILRDVFPRLDRLAIMANVGGPGAALEMHEFQEAARTLRLEVIPLEIRRTEDIAPALESLKGRVDALYVVGLQRVTKAREPTHAGAVAPGPRASSLERR